MGINCLTAGTQQNVEFVLPLNLGWKHQFLIWSVQPIPFSINWFTELALIRGQMTPWKWSGQKAPVQAPALLLYWVHCYISGHSDRLPCQTPYPEPPKPSLNHNRVFVTLFSRRSLGYSHWMLKKSAVNSFFKKTGSWAPLQRSTSMLGRQCAFLKDSLLRGPRAFFSRGTLWEVVSDTHWALSRVPPVWSPNFQNSCSLLSRHPLASLQICIARTIVVPSRVLLCFLNLLPLGNCGWGNYFDAMLWTRK